MCNTHFYFLYRFFGSSAVEEIHEQPFCHALNPNGKVYKQANNEHPFIFTNWMVFNQLTAKLKIKQTNEINYKGLKVLKINSCKQIQKRSLLSNKPGYYSYTYFKQLVAPN